MGEGIQYSQNCAQNPLPLGGVDVKAEVPGQDYNEGETWVRFA